jgi:isocitrate lyase
MDVPTLIMARTDADSAKLLTTDIDLRDRAFCTRQRTPEGFYHAHSGIKAAIARGISYAPYADMLWMETSKPNLQEAREFAEGIHAQFPGKLLAYNCSPSFNWRKHLGGEEIAHFQRELGAMGYKFQFITLAGFHALNHTMFELARQYKQHGMTAYSQLQEAEFESERHHHYTAVKHQRFVGTGYFDDVQTVITGGTASTTALAGSTETEQFHDAAPAPAPRAPVPVIPQQPQQPSFGTAISHPAETPPAGPRPMASGPARPIPNVLQHFLRRRENSIG